MRIATVVALGCAALVALTGVSPAQSPRYPTATATDVGSAKLIVEPDLDAPISGLQIFLTAGLDRQAAGSSGIAALVAECIARTPVDGTPVREAIALRGGTLESTVDGRSVHYYLEARPEALPAVVKLFGRALAAPDFSAATIAAARMSLSARINELEGNALNVGVEMFRRAYYATSAGLPTLGTTTTIANLSSADLASFFAQNYRRGGFAASAVGRVDPGLPDSLRALADALPGGEVTPVAPKSKPIPENSPRIVSHRDVGAPIVVVGFAAPSPGTADFGAMLILESLLSNAFERSSATTLGLAERSVGAFYLYDSSPASLVVYVNGTRVDPTLALRELLVVSHSLAQKPLGKDSLSKFKATAEGQFITDSINVSDRSYLLGTFAAQGLGVDPINAALASLEKTTPLDVQRVAKRYLQRYIVALVLPRQAPSP